MRARVVEALRRLGDEVGLASDSDSWSKIREIIELWAYYSPGLNLTGARDDAALAEQASDGVLCCSLAAGFRSGAWLDVGSGGGFPGLIVAALSSRDLCLLEPRDKRAAFLELALRAIGRSNGVVRRGRVTENGVLLLDGGPTIRRDFAIASCRGLFPVDRWLQIGSDWVMRGGSVLAHLVVGDPDPPGYSASSARESGHWSVRAYVPRGTSDAF